MASGRHLESACDFGVGGSAWQSVVFYSIVFNRLSAVLTFMRWRRDEVCFAPLRLPCQSVKSNGELGMIGVYLRTASSTEVLQLMGHACGCGPTSFCTR